MHSRNRKLRLAALILTAAIAAHAVASEEKAEGGEGEGEGKGAAQAVPKDQKEFREKTSRLTTLAARIEENEKQFNELIRRKATEKDRAAQESIIKQMNDVTKERNKAAEEYNKVKSELTLRYPNQGQQLNRRYQTQTKKSLEEMEGAAGLDELLTRTKKIVEKKFAPFQPVEEQKPKTKVAKPEEEKPQRLRLEK